MMELLTDFPPQVVAVRVHGTVTRQDYENVLIPAAEASLKTGKVRIYYELAEDLDGFSLGAAWDDMVTGLEHLTRWERIAMVTDIEWIRKWTGGLRFLMPCPVKVFGLAEAEAARAWISEGLKMA